MDHESRRSDDLTVVVPTLNEAGHIDSCLRSIAEQTLRPSIVLLVDGGSTDRTIEIARSTAAEVELDLDVVLNPARRVPHALNLALQHCSTGLMARIDAHATVSEDYLERVVDGLRVAEGAGGVKLAVARSAQGRANALALSTRLGVGGSRYHYATTIDDDAEHIPYGAYRTEIARMLGGWDESLPVNQDFEFDYRLRRSGGRIRLDPAARIYWQCRETLAGQFQQYRRYGAGKAAVIRKHPRSASARHVAPAGIPVLAVGTVITGSRIGGSVLVAYGAALAVGLARPARRAGVALPRAVASVAAMHVGYGVGLIEGAFGKGHSSQLGASRGDAS